jgi:hypothetical protein
VKFIALIKDGKMWPVEITTYTMLAGAGVITFSIIKSEAIPIYCSFSFNGDIICVNRIKENDISIAGRYTFAGGIIFSFGTSP